MEPVNLKSWKNDCLNGPYVLTTCSNVKVPLTGEHWRLHRGRTLHSTSTPAISRSWLPHGSHEAPEMHDSSCHSTSSVLPNHTLRSPVCDRWSVLVDCRKNLTYANRLTRITSGDLCGERRALQVRGGANVGGRWKYSRLWAAEHNHHKKRWWSPSLHRPQPTASASAKLLASVHWTSDKTNLQSGSGTKSPEGSGSLGQLGAI